MKGTWNGYFIPLCNDTQNLQNALSEKFVITDNFSCQAMMLGQHLDTVVTGGKDNVPLHKPWHYNEVILFHPNIKRTDRNEVVSNMSHLILDKYMAVIGGKIFYGFPKVMGRFDVDETSINIKTKKCINCHYQEVLEASIQSVGNFQDSLEGFAELMELFSQKFVQEAGEKYLVSFANWHHETMKLRPVEVSLKFDADEFNLMHDFEETIPPLSETRLGAVQIVIDWDLPMAIKEN